MSEDQPRDSRIFLPEGTTPFAPEEIVFQAPIAPVSRPDTTQEYRGHVCGEACSDIPDSGVYDAFNPGLNPILERSPGDLEG
jgi:hypothetical protein